VNAETQGCRDAENCETLRFISFHSGSRARTVNAEAQGCRDAENCETLRFISFHSGSRARTVNAEARGCRDAEEDLTIKKSKRNEDLSAEKAVRSPWKCTRMLRDEQHPTKNLCELCVLCGEKLMNKALLCELCVLCGKILAPSL
jgi:hypothetical protein